MRVNSGEPGIGLMAYQRVYLWFAGTTSLALTERLLGVMHPKPPKHESEIAESLERWLELERNLRAHGEEYEMRAALKVTALGIIMSCRREQFELLERESKSKFGDKISE